MTNVSRKFYIGEHAGCIGHTEGGYPIHNFFLVATKVGELWERCFQVQEKKGVINKAGIWIELEPIETRYEPVYKFNGEVIAEDSLVSEYEVIDATDAVFALDNLYKRLGKDDKKLFPRFSRMELESFSELKFPIHSHWEKAIKAVQAKMAE